MILLIYNLDKIRRHINLAKTKKSKKSFTENIKRVISIALLQKRILREKSGGIIHIIIFWGFLVLLFSLSNSILTGFGIKNFWTNLGVIYTAITFLTDLFSFLIVISVLVALFRRYFLNITRLKTDNPKENNDALIVLLFILFIVSALLLETAGAISIGIQSNLAYTPISDFFSNHLPINQGYLLYNIGFWLHSLLIFSFMNYLPFSKHFHVYSSIPNVFLANGETIPQISKIDFDDENIEQYGVADVEHFPRLTLLNSLTCTHCGRCTEVCPANLTGKSLDPKQIMMNIRDRFIEKMPIHYKQTQNRTLTNNEQEVINKGFINNTQISTELWQCTTCGACMEECPVLNDQITPIIEMRKNQVMMESDFPNELQAVFANLENNGAPWQFPQNERNNWTKGLNIDSAENKKEFNILFWVGCAGSYDERAKKVSIAFTQILNKANVDYAILANEEVCCGDAARRLGNEYLANILIGQNIETLKKYKFNRIVTTCPHCFNALKNEYPDFGATYKVIHHTELIDELIKENKISLKNSIPQKITYHDSCYLGRYNNIYDAPRNIINSIENIELIESKNNKDKALCCGGGGGQMFIEENEGTHINTMRIEQLTDKNLCSTIASNCPFCLTMLEDGLKEKNINLINIKDIAEITYENMQ